MTCLSAVVIGGMVLGALGLLTAVWVPSLRAASCDVATLSARQQLAVWLQESQRPVPWEAWRDVRSVLTDASERCADVSFYQVELAHLSALRGAQAVPAVAVVRELYYRQAIAHFRAALSHRPLSAATLAGLAQFKAYLGEFDAEYYRALLLSIEFGQHEPDAQLVALNAGLIGWMALNAEQRQRLTQLYGSALVQQPQAARALLLRYPAVMIDP